MNEKEEEKPISLANENEKIRVTFRKSVSDSNENQSNPLIVILLFKKMMVIYIQFKQQKQKRNI